MKHFERPAATTRTEREKRERESRTRINVHRTRLARLGQGKLNRFLRAWALSFCFYVCAGACVWLLHRQGSGDRIKKKKVSERESQRCSLFDFAFDLLPKCLPFRLPFCRGAESRGFFLALSLSLSLSPSNAHYTLCTVPASG